MINIGSLTTTIKKQGAFQENTQNKKDLKTD